MGKRSAVVELFLGDMGSIQRELRPSTRREDQLTMETKLEQIAVKPVNQLPKSVVREIRTPRSVGAGGGRPPPATRWARRNPRPYRDHWPRSARAGRSQFSLAARSLSAKLPIFEKAYSQGHMRRRDFMSFVGATAVWPVAAHAQQLEDCVHNEGHNGLGSFEQFLFGSRRNLWRLRRVEDRHPILANRG